jgi:hypothetical protein
MAPLCGRLASEPAITPQALVIERLKKVGDHGAARHNLEDRSLDTLEQRVAGGGVAPKGSQHTTCSSSYYCPLAS